MGNCCFKPDFDQKNNVSFKIILKAPHGKKCNYINNEKWECDDDVNKILKKLYNKKFEQWIIYNDETPTKIFSSGGHAKGILAWNNEEISWLIHSVPKFPTTFDGINLPEIEKAELEYGQSFIHLKMDIKLLDAVLRQIYLIRSHIYIENINEQYKNKNFAKKKPYEILDLSKNIHHVAKSPHYEKDFYTDIIIPKFGGNCYTETWVRGHHCEESESCKMIAKIQWENGIEYNYKQDHGKFCLSEKGWVMIGDLNRMTSQFKRGGGGVIIEDKNICKLFKRIVN